ncbi:MAG: hypothetical protein GKR88_15740 [Flavobacteriaceae bacterium]|nr:MAG: hypothetical protein GKR88_15740 [Flavobacteriaceae bacterium]
MKKIKKRKALNISRLFEVFYTPKIKHFILTVEVKVINIRQKNEMQKKSNECHRVNALKLTCF